MKELQVGEVLNFNDWYTDEPLKEFKIDRVTPKIAFSGKLKFKRQYSHRVQHIGTGHRAGNNYYTLKSQ
jgi:hypothetical protein